MPLFKFHVSLIVAALYLITRSESVSLFKRNPKTVDPILCDDENCDVYDDYAPSAEKRGSSKLKSSSSLKGSGVHPKISSVGKGITKQPPAAKTTTKKPHNAVIPRPRAAKAVITQPKKATLYIRSTHKPTAKASKPPKPPNQLVTPKRIVQQEKKSEVLKKQQPEMNKHPEAQKKQQPEVQGKRQSEAQEKRQPEVQGQKQPEVHEKKQPEVQEKKQPEVHEKKQPEVQEKKKPEVKKQLEVQTEIKPISEKTVSPGVNQSCNNPEGCVTTVDSSTSNPNSNICSVAECGEPLFASKLIDSGDASQAAPLCKVSGHVGLSGITSYSGFITVNKTYNSNLFFWFFPAMNRDSGSPLILWLQGAPESPAIFALFNLHGPFRVTRSLEVKPWNHTWARIFNILYVDHPVGNGFSFTDDKAGYSKNQDDVTDHLFQMLQQFYAIFPDYRDNGLYICGEGIGAKSVTDLASKIHTMGDEANINLKGVVMGNPLLEQESMTGYGNFFYNLGMTDSIQTDGLNDLLNHAVKQIHRKQWDSAIESIEKVFGDGFSNQTRSEFYFPKMTAISSLLHLLRTNNPKSFDYYKSFLDIPDVRKAIHVGNKPIQNGEASYKALREDRVQSVKSKMTKLLDNYRIMVYSGNLDIIVPYPSIVNFLSTLRWKHSDDFEDSNRIIWKVAPHDNKIAGYVHHVRDFFEVLVSNAGHAVPYDQPMAALDMISRFIWGKAFHSEK